MRSDNNSLKKLFVYYKKYKFLSIMVIILSLTFAGISLLSPIYEGKMLSYFENFNKYLLAHKDCASEFLISILKE